MTGMNQLRRFFYFAAMMEAMSVNEVLIYFSDLTEEAQQRVLAAAGIQDPKEANWDSDIVPLATISFEAEG